MNLIVVAGTDYVHQLVDHTSTKVTAKCGYTQEREPSQALDPIFTGWASKVTCTKCSGTSIIKT